MARKTSLAAAAAVFAVLIAGSDARLRRREGEEAAKCPVIEGRECSGHGLCHDHDGDGSHNCFCEPGFFGIGCDKESCVTHCSSHGACDITTKQCNCAAGWTGLDCGVSACPADCSGHGVCAQRGASPDLRACYCIPGWKGEDCSSRVCPFDEDLVECSAHGRCTNGTCACEDGFIGPSCSVMVCNIPCVHGECSCNPSRGECQCKCTEGFVGPMCDRRCPRDCNGNGKCDAWGRCVCAAGWTGVDCSKAQCPNDCNNRGVCHENRTCTCEAGWKGADCSQLTCPSLCNWRTHQGECLFDKCVCYPGFEGESCERHVQTESPCGEDCYDHCRTHSECSVSQIQRFVFRHEGLGDADVSVPGADTEQSGEGDQLGRKCYLQCLGRCFKQCFKVVHESSAEDRDLAVAVLDDALHAEEGETAEPSTITGDIADVESQHVADGSVDVAEIVESLRHEVASDEGRG